MTGPDTDSTDSHAQSIRIGFLGSEGSGKTCFLAALNWLANDQENAPFSMAAADSQTQVVFNELDKAFRKHRLPAPTHRTDDLVFDLRYGKRQYRITTHDIEGEAFKRVGDEMQTDDPIFADLEASDVLLVFLDADRDVKNADPESTRIAAISKLLKRFDMAGKHKRVAVLLTKADVVGVDSSSPAEASRFLKENLPALYKQLSSEIHESDVFFLAAIGHGELESGRDPRPIGFKELLDWIQAGFAARDARRRRRIGFRVALACIVALVCAAGAYTMLLRQQEKADEIVSDKNASAKEVHDNLGRASRDWQQQVAEELSGKARQRIESATSWREIEGFYKNDFLPAYEELPYSLRSDLREAETQLKDRAESLFAEEIGRHASDGNADDVEKMADQYGMLVKEGTFPGKRGFEIAKAKEEAFNKRKRTAKVEIKNIVIGHGDRNALQKKTTLVDGFQYYSDSERKEAKRAAEMSRLFQSNAKYSVSSISAGTLVERGKLNPLSNRTFIRISIGDKQVETEIKKAEHPEWGNLPEISWEVGKPILVEWFWKEKVGYAVPIATMRFDGSSTTLLKMLTADSLNPSGHHQQPKLQGARAEFEARCGGFDNPADDLEVFEKYIDPGTYWTDDNP